ncbi:MAG TPA: carboxypeptidase-like regulatory domain-containing protein [Thermoanaerobaculia bacterium]
MRALALLLVLSSPIAADEPWLSFPRGDAELLSRPLKLKVPETVQELTIAVGRETRTVRRAEALKLQGLKLPAGSWPVKIAAPHHRTVTFVATLPGDSKTFVPSMVELQPLPVIRGVIRDRHSGQPVPGAIVRTTDEEETRSEADGSFALEVAKAWPAQLTVEALPYAAHRINVPGVPEDTRLPEVLLTPGGAIRLEVTHDDDLSIEFIRYPRNEENRKQPNLVRYLKKEEKVLELTGVTPGGYLAVLRGRGPLERYAVRLRVEDGMTIERSVVLRDILLRIETRQKGEPVAASLKIKHDLEWEASVATGTDGVRELTAWQEGTAWVLAAPAGSLGTSTTERIGGEEETWRIDIPDRQLIGRIVDAESGKGIPEARVLIDIAAADSNSLTTMMADAEGVFTFGGLDVAEGTIRVHARGYLEGSMPFRITRDDTRREVRIPMRRGNLVTLQLVDASSGAPVADAMVYSTAAGTPTSSAADGTAKVMIPGSQRTRVFVVPRSGSFTLVDLEGRESELPVRVDVPAGAAQIVIRVKSEDGAPMRDVSFLFRFNGNVLPEVVTGALARARRISFNTDAFGVLTIDALPAGVYDFWPSVAEQLVTSGGAAPIRIAAQPGRNYAELTLRQR